MARFSDNFRVMEYVLSKNAYWMKLSDTYKPHSYNIASCDDFLKIKNLNEPEFYVVNIVQIHSHAQPVCNQDIFPFSLPNCSINDTIIMLGTVSVQLQRHWT